mmetsp:Transcript_11293/g.18386  ORF Transcript_11293/g.18386 Transcript_11293/m.18386 type:complete len:959 (-) Transcript_11293:257-3133(-)
MVNVFATVVLFFTSHHLLSITADTTAEEDRPQIVGKSFFEGITQPFKSFSSVKKKTPEWKVMKDQADKKASEHSYRHALNEYEALIRHPTNFGQMPNEEKYDIFISMSRLLKDMGFYQKAELLLYEAMSYSKEPYEAHYQLGLLFLDKEDIEKSKMHLKNCLFYKESDASILIYLSTILFAEGKSHEAKFYVSHILKELESKITNLSTLLGGVGTPSVVESPAEMNHMEFIMGLEDIIVKVFHAEFLYIPSATTELFRFYYSFFQYLSRDDLKGRFLFDLGQSLYEHGKSSVGKDMMLRGWETRSEGEGAVSETVVRLRTHIDYPIIPNSVFHVIESYLNMTQYLSNINESSSTQVQVSLENAMDVFWPIPLFPWSGLPMSSVKQSVMSLHFNEIPIMQHPEKQLWLKNGLDVSSCYIERTDVKPSLHHFKKQNKKRQSRKAKEELKRKKKQQLPNEPLKIELGVLGGHFNSHAIGHVTLTRVLQKLNRLQTPNRFGYFSITLLALPLIPDRVTSEIARFVHQVINLPADVNAALTRLEKLELDVLLFPDWQPFPDQQSIYFQSIRIAPVQVCYYVRGSSCASAEVDYYLLPKDVEESYLQNIRHNERIFGLSPPAWATGWSEQVVVLDWPVFTPAAITTALDFILDTGTATSGGTTDAGTRTSQHSIIPNFSPRDIEGDIFFEDQAVAIIPFHPSYVHPLMDEAIFLLLKAVPDLQVVIALPETYAHFLPTAIQSFAEQSSSMEKLSIQWAKQLVRRLWTSGSESSPLHQRIRLLPLPVSDERLLQLIKQADVVLDSFPIGGTLHPLALALSTGTPVVTLRSGTVLKTPIYDALDIKNFLKQMYDKFHSNPIYQSIVQYNSVPWLPSSSPLAALYERWHLDKELVASSVLEFARFAEAIVSNKDKAYQIRVKILEALEMNSDPEAAHTTMRDLSKFLRQVGRPWSDARRERKYNCIT